MASFISLFAFLLVAFRVAAETPRFGVESCKEMFSSVKSTGTIATAGVVGCMEVCDSARAIKEYWADRKNQDMESWACGEVNKYECVWPGTPPEAATNIGC